MLYGAATTSTPPSKVDPSHSVAVFAKHYENGDMIDLRYAWHEHDVQDRAAAGLSDPLPEAEGFRERTFNAATEW